MKQTLYSWQEECLKRWFANQGRGIVQAVTGSGKTRLALEAISRLEETLEDEILVKIVVPTGNLLRQWNQALRSYLEVEAKADKEKNWQAEIGLRGAGYTGAPADVDVKYMIYVINSARYELARQILEELQNGKKVLLIADECHHYTSRQNQLIFEFLPYVTSCPGSFFSLGLSATLPVGEEQRYLISVLGKKIYQYEFAEAFRKHTICQYDIYHIGLSFQAREQERYEELTGRLLRLDSQLKKLCPELKQLRQKERFEALRMLAAGKNRRLAETAIWYTRLLFQRRSLICQAESRTLCVCSLLERLGLQERILQETILIFGERIEQAEELYQMLQERYPGRIGRYHSEMGQQANKNVLERFRTGELQVLIACKGMDEGVDIPDVSIGIILSGTSAQRQRVQRLGRIIRNQEGKERASLYYLYMKESSEERYFLPKAGNRIFELEYQNSSGQFSHPAYDKAAKRVLNHSRRIGMNEEKIREIQRCLQMGSIRADWLLENEELERNLHKAMNRKERNYWICMKQVGECAKM